MPISDFLERETATFSCEDIFALMTPFEGTLRALRLLACRDDAAGADGAKAFLARRSTKSEPQHGCGISS